KSGYGKYIAIWCLMIVVLLTVGGFLTYRNIKGAVYYYIEEYTDTQPYPISQLYVSGKDEQQVLDRVENFTKSLKEGNHTDSLVLTSDDINILLFQHPDLKFLAEKIHVDIVEDKIEGQVSFPLSEFGGFMKNRYLNGSAVFSFGLMSGRLHVYLDYMDVKGKAIPEALMASLRNKNLLEDVNTNEEFTSAINKLQSIIIKDDKIFIVPDNVEGASGEEIVREVASIPNY
ncbi:MAG: hypothetical protein GY808_05985, partial [Gammaproteobacteria bacterium]|nr:hypothetical protein [Gammaproteobacteria bacterium]